MPDPSSNPDPEMTDADREAKRQAAKQRIAERHEQREQIDEAIKKNLPVPGQPLPAEAGFEVHDAKYCLGCNFDLGQTPGPINSETHQHECPYCQRAYKPDDATTYSAQPIEEAYNFWTSPPRVSAYLFVPVFLLGRAVLNQVGSGFVDSLDTMSGAVLGPVLVVFALLPWLLVCAYLALGALEDLYNPMLRVTVPLGCAVGVFLAIGQHPALLGVGAVAGCMAGLVYAWRSI